MAGELKQTDTTGKTVYGVIFSGANVWTGGNTFGAASAANMNANSVPTTEIVGTGIYLGNFPAGITTPGRYFVYFYEQVGGSPAVATDTKLGPSPQLDWNGTALSTIAVSVASVASAITLPANAPSTFLANDASTISLLGQTGKNQGVRNQTYDGNNNLLTCDICTYDTPSHAVANDGTTGIVHKDSLINTYTSGNLSSQVIQRVI